ncbi:MAG: hypothetical protein M9952_10515 [Microthrixaceae bacterium]|nr:hypothetical protein [Microthrixaceae bacterium]
MALATGCAAAGADIVLWGRNDTKNHAAVDTLRALGWMHGPSSATSQMRTSPSGRSRRRSRPRVAVSTPCSPMPERPESAASSPIWTSASGVA